MKLLSIEDFKNLIKCYLKKTELPSYLQFLDNQILIIYHKHSDYQKLKKLLEIFFINFNQKKKLNMDIINEKKLSKKKIKKIFNDILDLPLLDTIYILKNLIIYFQYFGSLYRCAFARRLYRQKLIELQKLQNFVNLDALKACIEINNLDYAEKILNTKKINPEDKKKIKEIKFFLNFCLNKDIKLLGKKTCSKYLKIIENSKILVLGPSSAHKNLKIYKNYKIIKTNFFNYSPNKNLIIYFNGRTVSKKTNQVAKSILNTKFTNIKSQKFIQKIKKTTKKKLNLRIFNQPSNLMLNKYGPTLIQSIVYDLFFYKPSKIFINSISFFLGNRLYKPEYVFQKEREDKSFALRVRRHDPFSNFCFMRNLFLLKKFQTTNKIKKILELSELHYAEKLDKKFKLIHFGNCKMI